MSLNGKHALITGSSRGIGRGIALKLAASGAKVAIHYYQNEAAANDTLGQVRKRGSDGLVIQADVRRPEQIIAMFGKVEAEFAKLDIFVSNARTDLPTFYQKPLEITPEQWDMAMDSQAKAFLIGAREAARLMSDEGRVIAITYSPGGRTGSWQPWVAMGSAKAALDSLVRYFAVALAPRRITVNGISPGGVFGPPNVVEGGVLRALPQDIQEATRAWHEGGWTPMRRLGTPEDIGNAVALLCMEEAGFITGQIIHVDGGASIMDTVFPLEIQQG
ncbi:MAG: short-chain dehydrogenase [Verrucomicrobia bacterium]|jgi:enoyl-[acyl-carrier protein] reductase III|nr:MAG: short-chain dehydrogenase [Verrucomicrobiota bacterium]